MSNRVRLGLVVLTLLVIGALYAEGVVKTGWLLAPLMVPLLFALVSTGTLARASLVVLLVISAVGLALSLLDLILRPTIGDRLHYTPTNVSARKLPKLPILGRWDAARMLDRESYGDLAAMAGDPALQERRRIIFQTDAFGFRNMESAVPAGLIVLGDSFPAGGGTSDEDVVARLLETKHGYRTYNLSYPGGPYDQFINFAIEWERMKVSARPSMIWTFYTGNDLDDEGGKVWNIEDLPWRHGVAAWLVAYRTYRDRSPLNQWMAAIRHRWSGDAATVLVRQLPDGRPMLFWGPQEASAQRSREEVEKHPNFGKLKRTLAAMRSLAEKREVDLTILILPTKGEVYGGLLASKESMFSDPIPSGFAQAVLAVCDATSIRCRDTKPYFISEARRLYANNNSLLWWRDDTHIGPQGHAALASFIAEEILPSSHQSSKTAQAQ